MTDRAQRVLGFVERNPGATPAKIARAVDLTELQVKGELSELRRSEGAVEPVGKHGWQAVRRRVP